MSENDSVCSTGGSSDGDSIKVFIRVRPLVTETTDVDLGTCLEVDKDRNAVTMRSKSDPKLFTFDEVADQSATQEGVFCSVGKKIIDGCISGYNGTIFAYGQTGSGKTFTMLGPHEDTDNFQHELRGVIPRSFEYLFKLIKKEQEIHGNKLVFLCKCSFLEIYNEQIFDLLDASTSSLQLRENIRRGVYVEGAQEQVVSSAHEAYQVLNRGWINRTVASTTMNRESSRSHAVFTVSIESKVNQNGVWNIKMSQLHLVDLAGSERQKDTNTTGLRLKEAGSINRSLSALGNVIMALVDVAHGKTRHIPYRDSKLSFLLRDSLGGNSKTYIVACVHPGSKCFGETLSTLHFARRAKMIKNKAVVNEDTQGSITHLQAEIKRLKETLLHCQQKLLVKNPSISSTNSEGSGDDCLSLETSVTGHSAVCYKSFFLQAMLFRNKSETEKRELLESLKKQQEVCNRKEQALRQMKMVLKFREDALRKIEKAQKEKTELSQDDKDDIIENLRSEVKTLQTVVDHHPEVVRYQMDNESLRAEVRRLHAEAKNGQLDQQKVEELEKMFTELQAENAETGRYPTRQQQQQLPTSTLTSTTIERQKTQLEKLQTELETVKREMTEELQRTQRELINKEAELVGVQKAKDELEKLFKAHQIRSQIERETRDDLHAETIKIMTTPKKTGYKIRNSIGPGCISRTLALSPLESAPDDGDMIGEEAPPFEWTEEQVDRLREEISKLQDELRALKIQLEEADRNKINLVQEKSLLEAEKELREKLQLKETKSQEDRIFGLAAEVTRLAKANTDYLTREKILTSELQDLRIMNEAADRKLTEVRNEAKEYRTAKDKEIAQFETQLMKLSIELGKVKEDLELTSEERDQLQDREETLQATLDFTSDTLKDVEERMKTTRDEVNRLELCLKNSILKVEELEQDKEKLLVQLQQETGVKNQQLMEALQTIELLRSQLQLQQSQLAADKEKMTGLQQNINEVGAECERLLKADLKKEEVLSSMTSRVTELKTVLQERERALEDTATELKEVRLRNDELEATCRTLEQRLLQQNVTNDDAMTKLQQLISAREVEYEMLQEDYQGAVSRVDNLGIQLDSELQRNLILSEKQKTQENEIVGLKSEVEKLQSQLNDYKSRLELTLNEKQELLEKDSEIAQHVAEKQQLNVRSVELEQKVSILQEAFDVISSQLDACKKDAVLARMELEEEKKVTEQQTAAQDEWQAKHQKLLLEFELERNEWLEKRQEVMRQLETMEAKVSSAEAQARHELQDRVNENRNLKNVIESMTSSHTEQEAEITRLRDCANSVYEEMDKLSSRNEELQEELLRQKKITDKLEADLCVQLNENAKLSGHQNHLQKIAYLDRLKDQVIKLEKENRILCGHLEKCKCKHLVVSSTPTRVAEAAEEKYLNIHLQ